MNTNQIPSVWADYSEFAPGADLTGACIHCWDAGTTCAVQHPTAAQRLRALGFGPL